MLIRFFVILILLLVAKQLFGQPQTRKLPNYINRSSTKNYAPFVSLDGNSIVFISDAGEDNSLTMCYTFQDDNTDWREAVVLPKHVNNRLNFLKGFALDAEGKTLYITSTKFGGIGGYDICSGLRAGNNWTEPVSMGLPINSKAHEACPSISADGNTFFFMRCEMMDGTRADKCKILMTRKKTNGQWEDPVELPASINSGNSQTPRIMADGETLIFSSNKLLPNMGGMDLYLTRQVDGQWTPPVSLAFANTAADDQYVSADYTGRYLLMDSPAGPRANELIEVLFSPELRPKKTIRVKGKVAGPANASSAFVSVFNMKDQKRVLSTKPGTDGTFTAYMKTGSVYELSVDPEADNFTFFSKVFDLTEEKNSKNEKVTVGLKPASSGDEILLDGISFKPASSELDPKSAQEIRRVNRLIQGNPDKTFSIMVTLRGYQVDSVRSSPDLTETQSDTVRIPVLVKIDSVTSESRDSLVVTKRFHNDRTKRQAQILSEYLIKEGVPAGRLKVSGEAVVEAVIENRKTLVKLTIR